MNTHDPSLPPSRPDRAPDEELFGEGVTPPDDVKARLDAAPYAEFYMDALGDDSHPYGWWSALIWLER